MSNGHHHHHAHHTEHHHHHHPVATFNRAFAIAVALNLIFTIVEAVYGVLANSMGLLADAAHNLSDVLGLLMAWGASWLLKRSPTEKYSYGFKKTTILAALGNALLLVLTSAVIIYESIDKLLHPVAIAETTVVVVALIGIAINGATALLFMRGQDDMNIKGAFLHLAYDALISVGVVIAGITIFFTKWTWLDPLVGLIIVIVILWGTWDLLRQSVDLILGAVPHGINQNNVKDYLTNLNGVEAVHDLHIWGLSTQETALTAHLVMPAGHLSDEDFEKINDHLQDHFKINHVTLQVEQGSSHNPCGQMHVC